LNPHGDMLEVWFAAEGAEVTAFAVKLEAFIEGKHREIVRYDTGHGRPHRDVLDWQGKPIHPRKRWAPLGTTNNQALTDAIDDITENWERYIDAFMRRRS
jgi:hypothetical protein